MGNLQSTERPNMGKDTRYARKWPEDPEEIERDSQHWKKAAERGDVTAQFNLGWCYRNGYGVEQDNMKAFEWYAKAAARGHADAQFNLALCFKHGRGVHQNSPKAAEWCQKSATQGHIDAQNHLAWCYEHGYGVEPCQEKAALWCEKAAAQGDECAQYNLGWRYENGIGVEKSDSKAAEWYAKAAEQEDPVAQYNLACRYEKGTGLPVDKKRAMELYKKSAEQHYLPAIHAVERVIDEACGLSAAESAFDALSSCSKVSSVSASVVGELPPGFFRKICLSSLGEHDESSEEENKSETGNNLGGEGEEGAAEGHHHPPHREGNYSDESDSEGENARVRDDDFDVSPDQSTGTPEWSSSPEDIKHLAPPGVPTGRHHSQSSQSSLSSLPLHPVDESESPLEYSPNESLYSPEKPAREAMYDSSTPPEEEDDSDESNTSRIVGDDRWPYPTYSVAMSSLNYNHNYSDDVGLDTKHHYAGGHPLDSYIEEEDSYEPSVSYDGDEDGVLERPEIPRRRIRSGTHYEPPASPSEPPSVASEQPPTPPSNALTPIELTSFRGAPMVDSPTEKEPNLDHIITTPQELSRVEPGGRGGFEESARALQRKHERAMRRLQQEMAAEEKSDEDDVKVVVTLDDDYVLPVSRKKRQETPKAPKKAYTDRVNITTSTSSDLTAGDAYNLLAKGRLPREPSSNFYSEGHRDSSFNSHPVMPNFSMCHRSTSFGNHPMRQRKAGAGYDPDDALHDLCTMRGEASGGLYFQRHGVYEA